MRDGSTRRVEPCADSGQSFEEWLEHWEASLVVVSGAAAGSEYEIDVPAISIGRGNDAAWCFDDDSMSSQHASIEYAEGGMQLRDLGSMNGCRLNGGPVVMAELKHGDRMELGRTTLQFVLEERRRAPRTYVIEED